MLVMVVPDQPGVPPWVGAEDVHEQANTMLAATRDAFAPGARLAVETDASVARALERAVAREHHDLLVIGPSRHATEGHVRIGKRTRQLIGHAGCALAVAPRGIHHHPPGTIARVGVGYGGASESEAALRLAGSLARAAAQHCSSRAVVDDRGVPPIDWSPLGGLPRPMKGTSTSEPMWGCSGRRPLRRPGRWTRTPRSRLGVAGRPMRCSSSCASVDLIVIGSRRWGPVARLLLGSTGEALLHEATCPILVAPRPSDRRPRRAVGSKGPRHSGLHAASLPCGQAAPSGRRPTSPRVNGPRLQVLTILARTWTPRILGELVR